VIRTLFAALLAATLPGLSAAQSQSFPTRQITIIVGVAPGGTLDALARQIAQGISPILKQPVVVENLAGAGGLVGFQRLKRSDPDGHTLNFSNMGLLVIPHLHPQGGFDPLNDLAPVASVATVPMVLAVSNASGFTDLKAMLAHMRQNPGKVNLGSGGPGTTAHLAQAHFLSLANVQGTLVQYRGTGPALIDVIAGTIEGIIDQTVTLMPLHADKRARAIAVSAPQRLARMPDVPTFAEAGLPQFDLRIWNGLVAPKGTPRSALERLAAAVSQVMDSPEYVARVEKQFASEIPSAADRGPDGFRRLLEKDSARVADLIKATGLQGK
jgi:tripartite-type tricarboxylate transporter receptor subunit TctC